MKLLAGSRISLQQYDNSDRALKIAVVMLLSWVSLVTVVTGTGARAAEAAGVNQYSPPAWYPLRAPAELGCVRTNCGGPYHNYWALDLLDPANASGDPVYAAGAGQATITSTGGGCGGPGTPGNSVLINHGSGVESYYTHLSSIAVGNGTWVDQNTVLGYMGSTGYNDPCPTNHLHYEKRVNGAKVDPGPLKACHGNNLVVYPDIFGSTDWNSYAPYTKTLHSDGTNCGSPPSQHVAGRMALLDAGNGIWAKDVMTYGGWNQQTSGGSAKAVAVGGDTQVLIDFCDAVWAKSTLAYGGWTQETACGSAKELKVSSTGLQMIMDFCGAIYAKKGIGYGGWVQQAGCGSARTIAVGGDRQVILDNCGAVWAKDTLTYGGWHHQAGCDAAKVVAASETGTIMIINLCDAVWAKGNNLAFGGWAQETNCSSAIKIDVGASTQVILDFCGAIYAKEGIGFGGWVKEADCGGAQAIDVGSNGRQMILSLDKAIWAKEGIGFGGWAQQADGNAAIAIAVG